MPRPSPADPSFVGIRASLGPQSRIAQAPLLGEANHLFRRPDLVTLPTHLPRVLLGGSSPWNSEPQRPRLGLPILRRRAGRRPLVAGIPWVVGREDSLVGRSDDLHSIPHSYIWVPLPPVSVVGRLWETLGENWSCCRRCATEAARWRAWGRRGCKENKKPRESRGPCSRCPGRPSRPQPLH